jgi:uncharacterized protein (TIGR02391 family)
VKILSSNEPNDNQLYQFAAFDGETVRFLARAMEFYEALVTQDIRSLESDSDLTVILDEKQRKSFGIHAELARIKRARKILEDPIAEYGKEAYGYDMKMSHGAIRYLKSVGLLYMSYLRHRRDIFASRPRLSRHALAAVDQQLNHLDEHLSIGPFAAATLVPLMANEPERVSVRDSVPASDENFFARPVTPRPVVIAGDDILDTELRGRCIDLFDQFKQDGQYARLDTVVSEATRILEDRIRKLCAAPRDVVGVELATVAFSGIKPKLSVSSIQSEQDAAHLLFRGVFGFIRNRVHHSLVKDLQPSRVIQLVGLVDYLISVAEGAQAMRS